MKKNFLCLLFLINIFFYHNAQALVGLSFRKQSLKTVGIIASGGGSAVFVSSAVAAINAAPYTTSLSIALSGLIVGPLISTIGLIVLDDNTIQIEFKPISNDSHLYSEFHSKQIEIFNNEIDELNAIFNTIQNEIKDIQDYKSLGNVLWNEYSSALSPETINIAQAQAFSFIRYLGEK